MKAESQAFEKKNFIQEFGIFAFYILKKNYAVFLKMIQSS